MNKEYVANVTEEELEQATGAGSGWIRTLTDDCPKSATESTNSIVNVKWRKKTGKP